eukprot:Lithocolla_globosa_v1_NODE_8096_length_862_cov_3.303594.p1 type:complete len:193 gc:universal NODE_8096_length_862_cov_3.303594:96-674(+)
MPLVIPGVFILPYTDRNIRTMLTLLMEGDEQAARQILDYYKKELGFFASGLKIVANILTDYMFLCPSRRAVRELASNPTLTQSTYEYYFDYNIPGPVALVLGTYHVSEVFYVFQQSIKELTRNDKYICDAFGSYWRNMAVSGNPNIGQYIPTGWNPYGIGNIVQSINYPVTGLNHDKVRQDRCLFWDEMLFW